MEFNANLRRLRKGRGWTQGELSEKLGYGYTAISNYESGRNEPSIKNLKRLAAIFEVSVDELIGVEKNE